MAVPEHLVDSVNVNKHPRVEGVMMLQKDGGPAVYFGNAGQLISVEDIVTSAYSGPTDFEMVVNGDLETYGRMRNSSVPKEQRWQPGEEINLGEDVVVEIATLSGDGVVAAGAAGLVSELTALANEWMGGGIGDPNARRAYKRAMSGLFSLAIGERVVGKEGVVVLPLRAARPAAALAGVVKNGVPVIDVHEKRLPLVADNLLTGERGLAVGITMDDPENWGRIRELRDGNVTIVEGCVATSFTIERLMDILGQLEALPATLSVVAGVVTQQGIESLAAYCVARGVKLNVMAGGVAYTLNEKCYIMTEVGEYMVGDAGDFMWVGVGDVWQNIAGDRYLVTTCESGVVTLRQAEDGGQVCTMGAVDLYKSGMFEVLDDSFLGYIPHGLP